MLELLVALAAVALGVAIAAIAVGYYTGGPAHPYQAYERGIKALAALLARRRDRR